MKKNLTLIFIIFLLFNQSIQAQKIEDIKRSSKNSNSNGGDNNSSSGCTDGLLDGCFEAIFSELLSSCFEIGCNAFLNGLFQSDLTPEQREEQRVLRKTMRENGEIPQFTSLEVFGNYGFIPNTYQNIRPRIRGRVGRFALDYRFNRLEDHRLDDTDIYTTHDVLLNFYIINQNTITWRLGTGVMTETYLDDLDLAPNQEAQTTTYSYPEWVTGLDIYIARQFRISSEFRWADNLGNDIEPRLETNLSLNYALVQKRNFQLELGASILYAKYFETVDIWTTGFGLALKFD